MTDAMAISGIKISPPVLALQLRSDPATRDWTPRLCRLLTAARVNIAFMTAAGAGSRARTLCCIDPEQRNEVVRLIAHDPQLHASVTFGNTMGLLTLYPHRGSIPLLGRVVQTLHEAGIPLHGLASSIAALTLATDYERLEEAASRIVDRFDLPRNVSPLKPTFTVRQQKRAH
ncbi:hypothetical protein [Desulfatitalea alkaliphila]|uniref:Uncharacterized protein n=1 Tax=Desulfatitalea alkaliphila TaxID=2929485 RepID=A0AA41UJT1_9BACT|nr:hypothetical protein [Desulfatitalea alkaliphila]MCJ8500787.1 hypothetical protein [Desulfatitalea alkaliphila]